MSTVWPLAARAQQPERLRRIGVLMTFDENDSAGKAILSGFTQGLAELGWTEGRNVRMDVRWTAMPIGCDRHLETFPDARLLTAAKTRALGIEVPPTLLAIADEVIERCLRARRCSP